MGKCFHETGRPMIASKYFERANRIFESKQSFGETHTITRKLRNFVAKSKPSSDGEMTTIGIDTRQKKSKKKSKSKNGNKRSPNGSRMRDSGRKYQQTDGSIASDPTSFTDSVMSCSSLGCGKISGLSGDRSVTFVPSNATIDE